MLGPGRYCFFFLWDSDLRIQISKNGLQLWRIALGVANGTLKNVSLGKFWQDLEISETFLISLEVSFFHGLFLLFLSLETFHQSLRLGFLTRILASRQVSDFTIRHPSNGTVHSCYTDPTQATVHLVIRDLHILRQEQLRVRHILYTIK